jgi:hypothetical protein
MAKHGDELAYKCRHQWVSIKQGNFATRLAVILAGHSEVNLSYFKIGET